MRVIAEKTRGRHRHLIQLMSFQLAQASTTNTDLVYLDIATLKANDVFVSVIIY